MDEQAELVGSVDDGIAAVGWSPDQELVVLVTGAGRLMLMSKDFDTMHDVTIASQQVDAAEVSVNVGWGKAETQFKGSAKHAVQPAAAGELLSTFLPVLKSHYLLQRH